MSSCFGGREEQIYLVELTVERLKLLAKKYSEEFADSPPVVKLKFIDFPVFEITRRPPDCDAAPERASDLSSASLQEYDENVGLLYASGKSCLFIKKPRDLVSAMKMQPLRVGIFRGEETFPIAETSVPLSGCLCDQVAMVGNDADHKPKPYELSGNYNVCDPGKNPAGSIDLFLRLTFFGSFIISHYQLFEQFCVFKNDYDGEYCITRINDNPDENEEDPDENEEPFKFCEGTVLAALRTDRVANSKD